jgi:deoxyhypusine synthase
MEVGTIEKMPVLWILPASHQPELKGGHTALHDFIFDFIVMVQDLESITEKELAEEITARIYDVIVSDRTLGKKVFDVRALNFDPSYEAVANSNIYWASCEFVFRLQRRE